jgi:hypothetical protein
LRKPPTTEEYTPLAELLDTASSNRGSIVGLIICAAENSRALPLAELRTPPTATAAVLRLPLRKPPTTDEHTGRVVDTASSNRSSIVGPIICAAKTAE